MQVSSDIATNATQQYNSKQYTAHQGRMWLPLTLSTLSRMAEAV
jgi:hypothetical protein